MKSWDDRAKAVIAQGALTYSKRSDQFVKGVYDTHITKHNFIDYVCGLGCNLNGYRNCYSLPHVNEVVLAERIKKLFPCIDKLRILKTGSGACEAALRIAMSYQENHHTGKYVVAGLGYHGWHNEFINYESPGRGTYESPYEKHDSLLSIIKSLSGVYYKDQCGAIIIEPVNLDITILPHLKELRRLCTKNKIVLIFDEIITGFRVPEYSIANWFGVQPDIICLGKALANGYPISIVGGKAKFMNTPDYFISTTFAGETSAINAALETLDFLTQKRLMDLWYNGKYFMTRFNAITDKIQLVGYATRATWGGDETIKAMFWQEMWKRGYLLGKAFFINFKHSKKVLDKTLKDSKEVIRLIEAGKVKLEGQLPTEVFKRT